MPAVPKYIFENITIIGVGLIGGCLALDIVKNSLCRTLNLCDSNATTRRTLKNIFVDKKSATPTNNVIANVIANNVIANVIVNITASPATAVVSAELVVIAAPLSAYEGILKKIAPKLKQGAIVSDVGSVKKVVCQQFQNLLPEHCIGIPAHPVAGTEFSGVKNAFHRLFNNRYVIITPIDDNPDYKNKKIQVASNKVKKLWQAIGANVISLTADKHDQILAVSSHSPHAISYAIVLAALEGENSEFLSKLSAGGFRDFTRIAASNPYMWGDVMLANSKNILQSIKFFKENLNKIEVAIKGGNRQGLIEAFQLARKSRNEILARGQAGKFIYNENGRGNDRD